MVDIFYKKLKNSEYWTSKTKECGEYVNSLKCPACGFNEAFARKTRPRTIFCHRNNECGVNTKLTDLFPNLWENFERTHPATDTDPHSPARNYLINRGLESVLEGLDYEYLRNIRTSGRGAVMFRVVPGEDIWNGRLFYAPSKDFGKSHNVGSSKGRYWRHPAKEWNSARTLYVTEGIIDALSLIAMGFQAAAILSSGQDPAAVKIEFDGQIILALDNDDAGHKGLKRWKAANPSWGAILPPKGEDWNDFLLAHGDEAGKIFRDREEEFQYFGRLACAVTGQEYAQVYQDRNGSAPGLFEFEKKYWWARGDKEEIKAAPVSNFTVSVDHFQLDVSNEDLPENRFFLKVRPEKGRPLYTSITASELSTPTGLTQVFLSRARVLWEGERAASLALARRIVESSATVVRQLQLTGYDEASKFYVFRHFAVDPKGKRVDISERGFFEVGNGVALRAARHETLTPGKVPAVTGKEILNLIHQAWGLRGMAAVSWVVGSWFVNQVKAKIGLFPFLSLWGDPATGKSRLARILNAMQAMDEEGLPMNKINTAKGEIRKLAQVSGLFRSLLETTEESKSRFDLDHILPLYNRNPLQTVAMRTGGNETRSLSFLSTILFVQNGDVFKTQAQRERVIPLKFKKCDVTSTTTAAFNQLTAISPEDFTAFFLELMANREEIETRWHDEFQTCKKYLSKHVSEARIVENYSILLTFSNFMMRFFDTKVDLTNYLTELAAKRFIECSETTDTPADLFFEFASQIQWRTSDEHTVDQDMEKGHLYVSIAKTLQAFRDREMAWNYPMDRLLVALREHPAFIAQTVNHRFPIGAALVQRKAWKFDLTKMRY